MVQTVDGQSKQKGITMFLLALFAAAGITFILKEPGFSDSQVYVLFLLFFAIGLWLTEAVPAFAVSLLIIAFLVFALGNEHLNSSPEKIDVYVQTFSSSVIWLMLGGFFLAVAMTKTKLDEALFRLTVKISGPKPRSLLFGLMLMTMLASMLMSNTATTAMVIASIMPLLAALDRNSGFARAVLLGIPIAAATGGMGTIIGTPPNAIAVGVLENAGISIGFIDWMKFGVPLALALTAISYNVLSRRFLHDNTPLPLTFLQNQETIMSDGFILQRRIVSAVIIVTVALWLTTEFHGIKVAAICAVPLTMLTLTGILDSKDVQALPWDTLLLVAGGLSLGLALENTGLLRHYAEKLLQFDFSTLVLIGIIAFFTMLVSNIMSNTAASTVMIPLGMALLTGYQMEIGLVVAFAASTAMFLPVSSPPNAVAYSTGLLEIKDFRLGGTLVGLLGPLLAIAWVFLLR